MGIDSELLDEKYSKYRSIIDGIVNYNELNNEELIEYKEYLEMMKEIGYFNREIKNKL